MSVLWNIGKGIAFIPSDTKCLSVLRVENKTAGKKGRGEKFRYLREIHISLSGDRQGYIFVVGPTISLVSLVTS